MKAPICLLNCTIAPPVSPFSFSCALAWMCDPVHVQAGGASMNAIAQYQLRLVLNQTKKSMDARP